MRPAPPAAAANVLDAGRVGRAGAAEYAHDYWWDVGSTTDKGEVRVDGVLTERAGQRWAIGNGTEASCVIEGVEGRRDLARAR
jgi:hypothetical protein